MISIILFYYNKYIDLKFKGYKMLSNIKDEDDLKKEFKEAKEEFFKEYEKNNSYSEFKDDLKKEDDKEYLRKVEIDKQNEPVTYLAAALTKLKKEYILSNNIKRRNLKDNQLLESPYEKEMSLKDFIPKNSDADREMNNSVDNAINNIITVAGVASLIAIPTIARAATGVLTAGTLGNFISYASVIPGIVSGAFAWRLAAKLNLSLTKSLRKASGIITSLGKNDKDLEKKNNNELVHYSQSSPSFS